MFKKPTPEEAVKMAKQMFDALTPKQQGIAIHLHVAAHGCMHKAVPAPVFSKAAENLADTGDVDPLLDRIGELYARNKGLQKGHATLTRRVQELETELALTKQQLLSESDTSFTVAGGQVFINEALIKAPIPKPFEMRDRAVDAIIADVLKDDAGKMDELKPITAADVRLQADIDALAERVADLEFAASPGSYSRRKVTEQRAERSDLFNASVEQQVEKLINRMLQPGGLLYRSLK